MDEALIQYGTAGLYAFLAVWVLGIRPHDRLNRIFAAYFLLSAAGALAFVALRGTQSPGDALLATRVFTWYSIPLVLVLPLFLDAVFGPRPRSRAWTAGLALAALATAVLLILHAVEPALFRPSLVFTSVLPAPLAVAYGSLLTLLQTGGLVLAARAASDRKRASLPRRQAAMVGLAFGVLAAHGGLVYGLVPLLTGVAENVAQRPVYIVGLVAVAATARQLLAPFEGRARGAALAALLLAVATGVIDSALAFVPDAAGFRPSGYINSRPLWVAVSAVALAIGVLRYGLAGVAEESRRRTGTAAGVAAALVLGLGASAAAFVLLGATVPGVAAAALGFVVPIALIAGPLRNLAPRMAGRVLLQADTLDVARERVRVYTAALRASAQQGVAPRAGDPVLAALRAELGLSDADHAVLAEQVTARPPGAAPQVFLGRYFVQRELGQGGTSTAYLARDSVLGRTVVVKRLAGLGDLAPAFAAEASALRSVQHPRVLRLWDAVQAGHEVFLVLEHAPGGSLEERLGQDGPRAPGEAVSLTAEVLEGLDAVHTAGLVHGDLKPANVLLTSQGHAKVADFGAARSARRDAPHGRTAPIGPAMGTLAAMAPEQVLGEAPTPRSDVYAAGALLFRLLTGEDYVDLAGLAEREARGRVLHGPPRLPHPRVPPALEPVLRRALAKEPEARWPSAAAMRQALAEMAPSSRRASKAR